MGEMTIKTKFSPGDLVWEIVCDGSPPRWRISDCNTIRYIRASAGVNNSLEVIYLLHDGREIKEDYLYPTTLKANWTCNNMNKRLEQQAAKLHKMGFRNR